MSGCWFPHAKFLIATQALSWIGDGYNAKLLMENSSVLADIGAQDMTGISVLDQFNGSGYGDQTLQNTDIVEDIGVSVNFVADNVDFIGISNGTRRAKYILVYKQGLTLALQIPMFVIGRAAGASHPGGGTISAIIDAVL